MKQKTVRLFFALWPDKVVRDQLARASLVMQLSKTGRRIRRANLHMTLHFIGDTDVQNAACLQQLATKVDVPPFSLQMDKAGQFKRDGIVWLGCSSTHHGLFRLHHQLGQRISNCDFDPEKRKYYPHVTFYRKATLAETVSEMPRINWQVNCFSLIRSEQSSQGVVYREIERYPLNQTLSSDIVSG